MSGVGIQHCIIIQQPTVLWYYQGIWQKDKTKNVSDGSTVFAVSCKTL